MTSLNDVLIEYPDVDKPPSIEPDDEEGTELNEELSKNNLTNAGAFSEYPLKELSNDDQSAEESAITERSANDSTESDQSVNESSTYEQTAIANDCSTNTALRKDSLTNVTQVPEVRMNANESRRSNESLKEVSSQDFIGKADLNLTEGALSLDELENNQVRLSWRPKQQNNQEAEISGYVIESKTKAGFWRQIRRVSAAETEVVLKVEEEDQIKYRIKAVKRGVKEVFEGVKMAREFDPKSPSPIPTSASGSNEEMALPSWKQKLIDKKMESRKQKEEEEEAARRKWSELPDWKRKLLETKGKSGEALNIDVKEGAEDAFSCNGPDREHFKPDMLVRPTPEASQNAPDAPCPLSVDSDGIESGNDAGDDSASKKSAGFWGVKLRKQRSDSKAVKAREDEEEEGSRVNYQDGAKRLWGVSLKVTEKGESAKDEIVSD